jgi:hypothetical protein
VRILRGGMRNWVSLGMPARSCVFSPECELGIRKGIDGYNLATEFPVEYSYAAAKDGVGLGWVKGTLLTGGKEVDWSRVEYPLPSFLVWSEQWEVLPDVHFVKEQDAVAQAKEVWKQIRIPTKKKVQ